MFKEFFIVLSIIFNQLQLNGSEHLQDLSSWRMIESSKLNNSIGEEYFRKNEQSYLREIENALVDIDRYNSVLLIWFLSYNGNALELAWWRSRDPAVRALIVSVYAANRLEPISGIPPFREYSSRFSDSEMNQRMAEIDWAENSKNRKINARLIYNWANRNIHGLDSDEIRNKLSRYREIMEMP